ncbi:hypothetical protein CYMTET_35700 [Cymbomonas tetramitiformis]|uniref:Uncharacterized protein n=1 Tax=Cymbomonas tetramitiformis TaxID=36881 RepID=A0AAE0F8N7_9CHLO|nr:hypothetical protein CYMTET_35700 [Cymbomonas tetramitiformis]
MPRANLLLLASLVCASSTSALADSNSACETDFCATRAEHDVAMSTWKSEFEAHSGYAISTGDLLKDTELFTRLNEIDWQALGATFLVEYGNTSHSQKTLIMRFPDSAKPTLRSIGPSLAQQMRSMEENPNDPVNPTSIRGVVAVPSHLLMAIYPDYIDTTACYMEATDFPLPNHFWVGWVGAVPNPAINEIKLPLECFSEQELVNTTSEISQMQSDSIPRKTGIYSSRFRPFAAIFSSVMDVFTA